jgi:hypothetical protein
MDQIWTFNRVYIYAGLLLHLTSCFPFILFLISGIYDMTPLRMVISTAETGVESAVFADMDGDSDIDIGIKPSDILSLCVCV